METNFKHRRLQLDLANRLFFLPRQIILLHVMFLDVEAARLFISVFLHFPDFLGVSSVAVTVVRKSNWRLFTTTGFRVYQWAAYFPTDIFGMAALATMPNVYAPRLEALPRSRFGSHWFEGKIGKYGPVKARLSEAAFERKMHQNCERSSGRVDVHVRETTVRTLCFLNSGCSFSLCQRY